MILEILASGLVYSGFVAALVGLAVALRPVPILRLRRRRAGGTLLGAGALLAAAGFVLPARETRSEAGSRLDGLVPVWQFSEHHSIRVRAAPTRVFRAVQEVTAEEIRLFRTLTWIRHPRLPWDEPRESMVAPPPREPILDVALRSGFVALAEEPGREIVVGAIVCCGPGAAARLLPRLRAEGPESFAGLADPGVAKAAMNFRLDEEAGGWTRLTTETRVYATDAAARRRFASYWRVIYPGSALIRRMWLRAVKARAEGERPGDAPAPMR